MRWTHVLLMHLVALATSHELFLVRGDRHDQRYPGLLVSVMTDLRVLPFERQGGLINAVVVYPVVTTRKYRENAQ